MALNCLLNAGGYDQKSLRDSISFILETTKLCSMGTSNDNSPHINTAYFAYTDELVIYFLSKPIRQHSLNLAKNPTISLTIFDSAQPFANLCQGLQIFGECILATGTKAQKGFDIYSKRFPKLLNQVPSFEDYEQGIIESKFYEVTPSSIKIFDEPHFGKDVWITASVKR